MPARSERARRRRSSAKSAAASGATVGGRLLWTDSGGSAAAGGGGLLRTDSGGSAAAGGGCLLRMDSAGCAAAEGGWLLRTDSCRRRALLPERTRSGRRSAVDLGPRLFCIAGACRVRATGAQRSGRLEGSGKVRDLNRGATHGFELCFLHGPGQGNRPLLLEARIMIYQVGPPAPERSSINPADPHSPQIS
jgi:hypothetical protein